LRSTGWNGLVALSKIVHGSIFSHCRSRLDPPPGSGDFASVILRPEKLSRQEWLVTNAEAVFASAGQAYTAGKGTTPRNTCRLSRILIDCVPARPVQR
jgi:hypothetical protein